MRAWLNNPLTSSLEQDIFKCSNILGYDAVLLNNPPVGTVRVIRFWSNGRNGEGGSPAPSQRSFVHQDRILCASRNNQFAQNPFQCYAKKMLPDFMCRHFMSSSRFHVERAIPSSLLRQAAGYAILSVLKVGMGWSAAVGTGLVVARRQDGSWSPPSAVGLGSFGWGLQAGGELTDLLLVLSNTETVKACSFHCLSPGLSNFSLFASRMLNALTNRMMTSQHDLAWQ